MRNPTCSQCGEEIVVSLSVLDTAAPWVCLECSGAALADFIDDEEDD